MRLKLDGRTRALVRRLPVVNVYSVLELILMAGLATQAARLVWAIATPVAPLGDWRPAEPQVPGSVRDLLTGFDPFFRLGGGQPAGPAVVTSLQLQLFGVRLNEASGRGNAIIAGPDGVQKSIAVGEEIVPGVKLAGVAFDHVTIDRGGATEDLFLDQSGAPAAGPPAPGALPPPGSALSTPGGPPAAGGINASQIRSDIGFTPRVDGGRLSGLVVRAQGSGAAFRAAGLRDGDVVTALGGRPVTGAGDVERVVTDFQSGGVVPMTVERGGQTLSLSLQVQP